MDKVDVAEIKLKREAAAIATRNETRGLCC